MKPSILIDETTTPDGEKLGLYSHDGAYSIRINGQELMSTRRHGSEDKLAEVSCEHVKSRPEARVLIGGLGFGFTLKAALKTLRPDATIVVAELMAAIIGWNKEPKYDLAHAALADERVKLVRKDVRKVMLEGSARYDAIILDVDNGPKGLTQAANDDLYDETGLAIAFGALRPGGCLAIWSAAASPPFVKRLGRAGFKAEAIEARAHGAKGGRHTIFFGRRT